MKKTDNANIVFVYGNKTDLKAVKYNTASTGTISASIGGNIVWQSFAPFAEQIDVTPSADELIVTILGKDYRFKVREGEMFYFVIIQEKNGEVYVERN